MPKVNPKHKGKSGPAKEMGVKKAAETCCVSKCSGEGEHKLSLQVLSEYVDKLGWKTDVPKKARRVALCKKHYKSFKKVKKENEKYTNMRDFGGPKSHVKAKSGTFKDYAR